MHIYRDISVDTTVLGTSSLLALAMGTDPSGATAPAGHQPATVANRALVGRWRSPDGAVRLEIKTDGTYAGAVAGRKRAAHGTYRVHGTTMTLRDDTGLRTAVTLYADELDMAGHRLARA
jgi:putative ligand-binding protein with streptavidin-like fold